MRFSPVVSKPSATQGRTIADQLNAMKVGPNGRFTVNRSAEICDNGIVSIRHGRLVRL